MSFTGKGWRHTSTGGRPKPAAACRGNEANMEAAKEKVIREIQYFVSCRTLTRLLEQGKITEKIRRRTVVALAEKYGVLRLPV